MRNSFKLLILVVFLLISKFSQSQSCNILGCASTYGPITANTNVLGDTGFGSCYFNVIYKQAYWEFFYSPNGGNFEQIFTPVNSGGDPLDIDYSVYDMGITGPGGITCPVNVSGFTEVICQLTPTHGNPTGPGLDGSVPTIAGHYYAVIIYVYQDADATYSFNVGAPTMDGIPFDALNCPGVLPVQLKSFAAKTNDCKISLNWSVEAEQNLDHYEIHHSSDGQLFSAIGTIKSAAFSNTHNYEFEHRPSSKQNFYRLKMIDHDGKFKFSSVVKANLSCKNSNYNIYPNPVADILTVGLIEPSQKQVSYNLFDARGNRIRSGLINGANVKIDFTNLAAGIYLLQLQKDGIKDHFRIVH